MFSVPASDVTFVINKSSSACELWNEQQLFCATQLVRDDLFMTTVACERRLIYDKCSFWGRSRNIPYILSADDLFMANVASEATTNLQPSISRKD